MVSPIDNNFNNIASAEAVKSVNAFDPAMSEAKNISDGMEAIVSDMKSIQDAIRTLALSIQDQQKSIAELKGRRPKAPGAGATEEEKAAYQDKKAAWEGELQSMGATLERMFSDKNDLEAKFKEKSKELETEAAKLAPAQRRDAERAQKATENSVDELNKASDDTAEEFNALKGDVYLRRTIKKREVKGLQDALKLVSFILSQRGDLAGSLGANGTTQMTGQKRLPDPHFGGEPPAVVPPDLDLSSEQAKA